MILQVVHTHLSPFCPEQVELKRYQNRGYEGTNYLINYGTQDQKYTNWHFRHKEQLVFKVSHRNSKIYIQE